jgi:exonuclease VII small subunit
VKIKYGGQRYEKNYYFCTIVAKVTTSMKKKALSYAEAFSRLSEIQILIESDKMEVDELNAALQEASALLTFCKDTLHQVNEETLKIIQSIQE